MDAILAHPKRIVKRRGWWAGEGERAKPRTRENDTNATFFPALTNSSLPIYGEVISGLWVGLANNVLWGKKIPRNKFRDSQNIWQKTCVCHKPTTRMPQRSVPHCDVRLRISRDMQGCDLPLVLPLEMVGDRFPRQD